jgi:DNA ligase-1
VYKRQERNGAIGKLVKYKYFAIGVKDAPRHPVFLGFRSKLDFG